MNASGSSFAINGYDSWGVPNSTNVGRFQYTGQAWLPEIELYHYKARIYSPTLGRFLQTDPVGYEDQMNLYAYVGNDPINATDPSGKETSFDVRFRHRELAVLRGEMTAAEFYDANKAEAVGALTGLSFTPIGRAGQGTYRLTRAAIGGFLLRRGASKSFDGASKFIAWTTQNFARTGGRSGRTTFQSLGSGGQKGADKLFNRLTRGKSRDLDGGGRLGKLADGSAVQISTRNGVSSVRIRQNVSQAGSRIRRTRIIKVRFE